MNFYILSLKWTRHDDEFVTFWRPNNAGYAYPVEWSGVYSEEQVRADADYYNNADSTLAIPVDVVTQLAQAAVIDRHDVTAVKNTERNLRVLRGAAYKGEQQ